MQTIRIGASEPDLVVAWDRWVELLNFLVVKLASRFVSSLDCVLPNLMQLEAIVDDLLPIRIRARLPELFAVAVLLVCALGIVLRVRRVGEGFDVLGVRPMDRNRRGDVVHVNPCASLRPNIL